MRNEKLKALPGRIAPWLMGLVVSSLACLPAPAADKGADKSIGKAAGNRADAAGKGAPGGAAAKDGDKGKRLTAGEKFLGEARAKLANYSFGAGDRARAESFVRQAKSPAEKLPYLLALAEYERVFNDRPDKAALLVGGYVLPEPKLKEWEEANREAVKAAEKERAATLAAWKKTRPAAKAQGETGAAEGAAAAPGDGAPAAPSALAAPLPPAAEWNVTADNVGAAVEMAACLVAAGMVPEALAALAKIGTNFADASRVRAVELAGDLYMRTAAYGDAVTAYGYGVQYVDAALGREVGRDEAGNYARELSEADKALRERLQRKLWQAEARRDAERYGPDWRLYKEATAAEWQERDYAKAYVRYQKLIADHPETVYAEAARCYRLKALFQLAAVSDKDAARAAAGREWALKQAQKLAQAAQRAKVARPVLRALQKRLDEAKAELQELRSVPHGEKAEKLAFKELEKFLKDNELGLYRGEALLAAGDYLLETRLTVEGAGRHYERALAWLDKAEGADAALKDFALPGRSAAVARPPAAERKIVRFGDYENNVKETVAPGAVVNRLTAPWYAPKLRRDALIHLGLLAYAQGKYEAAAATWDKIAGLDPYYAFLKERGYGSGHSRLMWAAQKTPGAIYAKPEQMQGIHGARARLAVLLGDMHYVNEEPQRALGFYRRLLAGDCGACGKEETAYAIFGVFACYCWDSEKDDVQYLKENLDKLRGTRSEPRALLGYANRIGWDDSAGAGKVYRDLVKRYPQTEEGADACFFLARDAMLDGDHRAAAAGFKQYLTMRCHENHPRAAKKYLEECQEKLKGQKQKK